MLQYIRKTSLVIQGNKTEVMEQLKELCSRFKTLQEMLEHYTRKL